MLLLTCLSIMLLKFSCALSKAQAGSTEQRVSDKSKRKNNLASDLFIIATDKHAPN